MTKKKKEEKTVGRLTKLTPKVQEDIVTVLRAGNYFETASAYAGISKSTFYNWLKRGERELQRVEKDARYRVRQEEEIYVDFVCAVKEAVAEAEVRDVLTIGKASDKNWQASAWRLERRYPEKWGRKLQQQVEHSGQIDTSKRAEEIEEYLNDI